MDFNLVINDIFLTYKENINNDLLSLDDMNSINKIFFNYINSYYFQDLYKTSYLRETEEGYIYPIIFKNNHSDSPIKVSEQFYSHKELIDSKEYINLKENVKICSVQSFLKSSELNELDEVWETFDCSINDNLSYFEELNKSEKIVIDKLKSKNNIYAEVFEDNEIKKSINLKKRNDIKFSIIDNKKDMTLIEFLKELKAFNKIPTENIKSLLIENYGIKFLKDIKNIKKCIVAHTDSEIAGLLIVDNSFYLKRMGVIDYKNFDYISSISVSLSFRGNKIGIRMLEELTKESANNGNILIMSQFTNFGLKYLKDNVDNISRKNNDFILINEDEKDKFAYKLIEHLFNNDEKLIINCFTDEEVNQQSLTYNESKEIFKKYLERAREITNNDYEKLIVESIKSIDKNNKIKQKIKVN